jgi:hypothetical protein
MNVTNSQILQLKLIFLFCLTVQRKPMANAINLLIRFAQCGLGSASKTEIRLRLHQNTLVLGIR